MTKQADLQQEIKNTTQQLISKFQPEKIILFGSAAQDKFGPDSDLDFLVIKKDSRSPLEVEQHLHSLINYSLATDFVFLNPQEFNQRLEKGDFIIKQIVDEGKVLYG